MAEKGQNQNQKGNKEEKKRMKAVAKEKAYFEKAERKAKAQVEKERLKEERRAAKEAAKKQKEAAVAAAATAVSTSTDVVVGNLDTSAQYLTDGDSIASDIDDVVADENAATTIDPGSSSVSQIKKSRGIKIVPAAAVVVSVGAGAYTLKMVRDRSAAEEVERQRQFKLLMGEIEGGVSETSTDSGDSAGNTLSDLMYEYENLTEENDDDDVKSPEPTKSPTQKPKKRRGLKSVFRKNNNNDREIDIAVLIAPEAKASEFSQTLAKILTFGAPGRFPKLTKLSGDMPMETFDLDKASNILMEAQDSARITKEESAEIFANVVNCMLIDIVDLASTSLKEKDEKVTTDALGIVITFMDLAAQLYTSIADGVDIVPVTYGGDISKKKLEKMYSTYAVSGMMDMSSIDEKFDDRVSLLQDVFQISPKKAEGLMTKAMQKNMMEMMKSGEMPDGMEDMMKGMDGMGLPGMEGMEDGEEPNPEQLKEMLRALKDLKSSGSVPESEINEVKKQFKEAFGSNIDEVMKNASDSGEELGEADQELLDLMKSILD